MSEAPSEVSSDMAARGEPMVGVDKENGLETRTGAGRLARPMLAAVGRVENRAQVADRPRPLSVVEEDVMERRVLARRRTRLQPEAPALAFRMPADRQDSF